MQVLEEEKLAEHSARLGEIMIPELSKLNPAVVKTVRGKGLMNAIEINPTDGEIVTFITAFRKYIFFKVHVVLAAFTSWLTHMILLLVCFTP